MLCYFREINSFSSKFDKYIHEIRYLNDTDKIRFVSLKTGGYDDNCKSMGPFRTY